MEQENNEERKKLVRKHLTKIEKLMGEAAEDLLGEEGIRTIKEGTAKILKEKGLIMSTNILKAYYEGFAKGMASYSLDNHLSMTIVMGLRKIISDSEKETENIISKSMKKDES